MKQALIVLLLIGSGFACTLPEKISNLAGCGLKCPKFSSCKVVSSGVFGGASGCVCDAPYDGISLYPSKDHPCPDPKASPSPSPAPVVTCYPAPGPECSSNSAANYKGCWFCASYNDDRKCCTAWSRWDQPSACLTKAEKKMIRAAGENRWKVRTCRAGE